MPRAVLLVTLLLVAGGVAWTALREPAAPAPTGGTVVWAVGDAADGSARSRRVARLVTSDDPRAVLYLGDVYELGTREDFEEKLRAPYRSVIERMLPTPGNHEWPRHRTGYDPFWRSVTGRRTRPWYTASVAGWEIVSLNSEARHDAASPQLRWLREHMRNVKGTCRIAMWHRPRFNAGEHGDAPDVQPFWDAVKGRAALVLNGHDHNLQRFKPRDGTVQIITGAGGREHHEVSGDARVAFGNDSDYGGLRLSLRGDRADLEFVAAGGRVLDRSSVRCRRG